VTNELQRLENTGNAPSIAKPTSLSIEGHAAKVTPQNLNILESHAGPQIHSDIQALIGTSGYKALPDANKALAINSLLTQDNTAAKEANATSFQIKPSKPNAAPLAPLQNLNAGSASGAGAVSNVAKGAISKEQLALDKTQFINSGKQTDTINGQVWEKTASGATHMTPVDYQYKTSTNQIAQSKTAGDYTGYMSAAQTKLQNIASQLQKGTSSTNAQSLAKTAASLQKEVSEYSQYQAFTKPTGAATYKAIGTITGANTNYVDSITQTAPKYNVDINAAMAVAAVEGLGGGVGDNGTSFGPFQMHAGGALPPGKTQAWAESPAGIDYALQQIGKVAGGLTGQAAINAIVNGFEKPANPSAEAANALSIYSGGNATISAASGGTSSGLTSIDGSTSSSSSSSSTAKPKVQNYKTTGGANIKAPKFKAITVKGSKATYKAPKVPKAKISTPKATIKSSKPKGAAKLPVSAIPKVPKKQLG
jgi:Skp family chaperone for outer membrane proteins